MYRKKPTSRLDKVAQKSAHLEDVTRPLDRSEKNIALDTILQVIYFDH